jgi:hypothetical protein
MAVYTTIDNPELYFQTKLYTGTGSSNALTLDGDENMQPDFVWIKHRSGTNNHLATDAVRGSNKLLYPDLDNAEGTSTAHVTAFGSDGFTVATDGVVNEDDETYVAWCWKAGAGSGSSNTDGSINTTSTSVSTAAGFSISTYTGTGSAATVGHGLGAVPEVVIVKKRNAADSWWSYHKPLGNLGRLNLDTTNAVANAASYWNSTTPTSSVFSLLNNGYNNESSSTYVAYCFAPKQGFSKFGSYTGTGNADGPFIYTGFKPAFIMTKEHTNTSGWKIWDNKRNTFNVANETLDAESSNALSTTYSCDFLSNGVKLLSSSSFVNQSGESYIFIAFAESPFVNSNGVPCNAR